MTHETTWRLVAFVGVLMLMMLLEAAFPKRNRQQSRRGRWVTNLSLAVINSFALKVLGPVTAVVAADYALDNGWGMLSLSPFPLPFYLELLLGVVLLDLAIYLQHIAFHKIPFLWRLHKVHHVDRDIDVTTGIRFHPLESVISMIYKCVVIVLLGPITLAVILFEIVLNASAMFNHANFSISYRIDAILRKLFVTPDFHRVHHSLHVNETNSNYGFFLSIWDRLGNTYIVQPRDTHEGMTIGLSGFQSSKPAILSWCLILPFKVVRRGRLK